MFKKLLITILAAWSLFSANATTWLQPPPNTTIGPRDVWYFANTNPVWMHSLWIGGNNGTNGNLWLNGVLFDGRLLSNIVNTISNVDLLTSNLTIEVNSRIASDAALSNQIYAVSNYFIIQITNLQSLLQIETTNRINADRDISNRLDNLNTQITSTSNSLVYLIGVETTNRIGADSALSNLIANISVTNLGNITVSNITFNLDGSTLNSTTNLYLKTDAITLSNSFALLLGFETTNRINADSALSNTLSTALFKTNIFLGQVYGTYTNISVYDLSPTNNINFNGYSITNVAGLYLRGPVLLNDNTNSYVQFPPLSVQPAYTEGRMFYETNSHTIAYFVENPDVTLNIGQELWIRGKNTSGNIISNGQPIHISGQIGTEGVEFDLAQAITNATADSGYAVGLATHTMSVNEFGYATIAGLVHDIDTSDLTIGMPVYLSTNRGRLTATLPPEGYTRRSLGIVSRVHNNQGVILVNPRSVVDFTLGLRLGLETTNRIDADAALSNLIANLSMTNFNNIAVSNIQFKLDGSTLNSTTNLYTKTDGIALSNYVDTVWRYLTNHALTNIVIAPKSSSNNYIVLSSISSNTAFIDYCLTNGSGGGSGTLTGVVVNAGSSSRLTTSNNGLPNAIISFNETGLLNTNTVFSGDATGTYNNIIVKDIHPQQNINFNGYNISGIGDMNVNNGYFQNIYVSQTQQVNYTQITYINMGTTYQYFVETVYTTNISYNVTIVATNYITYSTNYTYYTTYISTGGDFIIYGNLNAGVAQSITLGSNLYISGNSAIASNYWSFSNAVVSGLPYISTITINTNSTLYLSVTNNGTSEYILSFNPTNFAVSSQIVGLTNFIIAISNNLGQENSSRILADAALSNQIGSITSQLATITVTNLDSISTSNITFRIDGSTLNSSTNLFLKTDAITLSNNFVLLLGVEATNRIFADASLSNQISNITNILAGVTVLTNTAISVGATTNIPATNTSAGVIGTIAISTNYAYFCVRTNLWKRVALSSW